MPRPRTREFIEDCGRIPVKWFTPLKEGSAVYTRREIWVGPREFQLDLYWSVDSIPGKSATLNVWYDVYTTAFSGVRRLIPRGWRRDEIAVEGTDYQRHRVKLTLLPKETPVGTRGWEVLCPGCGKRRKSLYLQAKSTQLACHICHNLRYESQERPTRKRLLPHAEREMTTTVELQRELITRLLREGSPELPPLVSMVALLDERRKANPGWGLPKQD